MDRLFPVFQTTENIINFVNGVNVDWAPVSPGLLQGTDFGPLLFSMYINDISTDIEKKVSMNRKYHNHTLQIPGVLNFSSYVGSGPASTVHPQKISGISSNPKNI